jgi:nucleoside-diphosphate-sugar epimerase
MVIGNGLIASAFMQYNNDENVIIFTSGVSNSKNVKIEEFEREINLIKKYINLDKKLIYFSTCSISDSSRESDYIKHKIFMEDFIKKNHNNYIIFRLPIVIGKSDNKNTFFNNIKSKIIKGDVITIYANMTRYLIDIDDISNILPTLINNNNFKNYTMDICFNNREKILDIVHHMEELLNIKSEKKLIYDELGNLQIDNNDFISKINEIGYQYDTNYTKKVIKKYL